MIVRFPNCALHVIVLYLLVGACFIYADEPPPTEANTIRVSSRLQIKSLVARLSNAISKDDRDVHGIEDVVKDASQYSQCHDLMIVDAVTADKTAFANEGSQPSASLVRRNDRECKSPGKQLWKYDVSVVSMKQIRGDSGSIGEKVVVFQLTAKRLGEDYAGGPDKPTLSSFAFAPFAVRLSASGNCDFVTK